MSETSEKVKETQVNLNEQPTKENPIDLTQIKGVESETIDLEKHHKKNSKIEIVEVMQVNSKFTPLIQGTQEHMKQWVLKIASEVLETVGEGEEKVEFRASELFNLIQDDAGNIKGFPKGEKSNLGKLCKDLKINLDNISNLKELMDNFKGKEVTIKSYDKEVVIDGETKTRTYLKFLY